MSPENEKSFEPHSDEDLATILEAQLLAMRGGLTGSSRDKPASEPSAPVPAWTDQPFYAPTQEMTAAEVVAMRVERKPSETVPDVVISAVVSPDLVSYDVVPVGAISEAIPGDAILFPTSVVVPHIAPMPLMFSSGEMARMTAEAKPASNWPSVAAVAVADVMVDVDVDSGAIVVDVVDVVDAEAIIVVEDVVNVAEGVQDSPPTLPELPVFVRRSFDDLISGS